ncbi:MAG TPA: hypothetical protein VMF03_06100 [Steroidobacteraceae bacterium]|nr:hypothetical protein [Steroidobacteraceae bacterium]
MDPELAKVREWAQAELDELREPPWATGRYHHLIQAIDRILAPRAAPAEKSPRANVIQFCTARRRSPLPRR